MPDKLVKPYKDFPLTPHPRGYWVKNVNGKQRRFGSRWCKPNEALLEYLEFEQRGIVQVDQDSVTLREGLYAFLRSRKELVESGELTNRSYADYNKECKHIRDELGATTLLCSIGPQHFSRLRTTYTGSPNTVSNRVGRARVVFNYLKSAGLMPSLEYGPSFKKPSAKTKRQHRDKKPEKLFTPDQIHSLSAKANDQMAAMIWLGLFAGFGNTDCGTVESRHFIGEWVVYPRPKTSVKRRAWLPSYALESILAVEWPLKTRYGNPWSQDRATNPISKEFRKLADSLSIPLSFYALRHTCETIGGRCKDQVAVDYVMGHVTPGMSGAYREGVDDDRLKSVGAEIEKWLGKRK